MKAIRKDEIVDPLHSMYVEQYDREKVIMAEDRTIDYLKKTVEGIYKSFLEASEILYDKYPYLSRDLPQKITFITSQELEDKYPDKHPEEREYLAAKEYGSIFII
jgi:aspartate--ammonia ligase